MYMYCGNIFTCIQLNVVLLFWLEEWAHPEECLLSWVWDNCFFFIRSTAKFIAFKMSKLKSSSQLGYGRISYCTYKYYLNGACVAFKAIRKCAMQSRWKSNCVLCTILHVFHIWLVATQSTCQNQIKVFKAFWLLHLSNFFE